MSDLATVLTVGDLEAAVGARPPGWHAKSIDVLDQHCVDFLALAPFAVLAVEVDGRLRSHLLGGPAGFLTPTDANRLRVPGAPDVASAVPAALVILVPGFRETLRINGRVEGGELLVTEAFLHCAKCLIRSELWAYEGDTTPPSDSAASTGVVGLDDPAVRDFLALARFATIASIDEAAEADVSPKGDPAGFLVPLDATTLAIPDRPGNRRTDTFHNLIARPDASVVAFVAGDLRALHLSGRAEISTDEHLRAGSEVQGNVPKAMLVLREVRAELRQEPALTASGIWSPAARNSGAQLPRASAIWKDHLKLNSDSDAAAKAARLVPERLMRMGLDHDYKTNLY